MFKREKKSIEQCFLCICFQEKRSLPGDREQTVKRAFKCFVEERDDKYTMELLLLPSALKEELLGLAQSPTTTNSSSQVGVPLFNMVSCSNCFLSNQSSLTAGCKSYL